MAWLKPCPSQNSPAGIQQFPDASQVMVIVLRPKVQVVDQTHGLLQARMQHRSGKDCGGQRLYALYQTQTCCAEVSNDLIERTGVVIGFVGFSILQIGGGEFGVCPVIVCQVIIDPRDPQGFEVEQMSGVLLG